MPMSVDADLKADEAKLSPGAKGGAAADANGAWADVGAVVEREIDGLWFPARIIRGTFGELFDVEYLDDGNVETDVPRAELRPANVNDLDLEAATAKAEAASQAALKVPEVLRNIVPQEEIEIIECQPKVVRHGVNDDTRATALVLGAEQGVAHGGGLRALRSLRRQRSPGDAKA
uniref:Tudor domain-containing protein n=1 Tax=Phaeomonas parva TaxID=124430 RepID=A0A7S1TVG1_9STRA